MYRSNNEFKKDCQPRTDLEQGKKGDLLAKSHRILNRWTNHCCQLMKLHGADDDTQIEIHKAEPLVPESRPSQVEMTIEKLITYTSVSVVQIAAELTEPRGTTERSDIQKLLNSVWG